MAFGRKCTESYDLVVNYTLDMCLLANSPYRSRLDGRQDLPAPLTDPSGGAADKPLTQVGSTPLAYGTSGRGGSASSEGQSTPPQSSASPAGKHNHRSTVGETYAKALRTNDAVFNPEDILQEELTYYSCHGGTERRLGNMRVM